jgi:pyridoxal 5'-phosphate synthase pdxS subunit
MLKGGVIMDVTDAAQARIAEDAGAVAVMALERVPADIRREGGVARMADPAIVESIQSAVSIPVMAKCRIGHFAEARVLEALGVDFIDESEVLTPADEEHHVDKHAFTVPFVCGCRDLGEALRRIGEGAALLRTKGEAGTGDVVEAVRHLRAVSAIRRVTLGAEELMHEAKTLGAPYELVRLVAAEGRLQCRTSPPAALRRPRTRLMMSLGAGPYSSAPASSSQPTPRRAPRGGASHHPLPGRAHRRQVSARPGRADAGPAPRRCRVRAAAGARLVRPAISVLALRATSRPAPRRWAGSGPGPRGPARGRPGAWRPHPAGRGIHDAPAAHGRRAVVQRAGASPPPGCAPRDARRDPRPASAPRRPAQPRASTPSSTGTYCRQVIRSGRRRAPRWAGRSRCLHPRAPLRLHRPGGEVLGRLGDDPVLLRRGRVIAATFHPEIAGDDRLHQAVVALAA